MRHDAVSDDEMHAGAIVSNEHDFFEDFEAAYGANLPSVACTFGNEWELYVASLAETSAQVKRAVEKLRGAGMKALIVDDEALSRRGLEIRLLAR